MQYSPKLKKAAEEIKEILNRYDIAGVVLLHTPGHSEYLLRLDPSYSCANMNEKTGEVRLKATEALYGKEKRDKMLEDTANMIVCLSDLAKMQAMNLIKLHQLKEKPYILQNRTSLITGILLNLRNND